MLLYVFVGRLRNQDLLHRGGHERDAAHHLRVQAEATSVLLNLFAGARRDVVPHPCAGNDAEDIRPATLHQESRAECGVYVVALHRVADIGKDVAAAILCEGIEHRDLIGAKELIQSGQDRATQPGRRKKAHAEPQLAGDELRPEIHEHPVRERAIDVGLVAHVAQAARRRVGDADGRIRGLRPIRGRRRRVREQLSFMIRND